MDLYRFKKNTKDSTIWWCIWPIVVYLGFTFFITIVVFGGLMLIMGKEIEPEAVNNYLIPMNIIVQVLCTAVFLPVYLNIKKKALPVVTKKCNWKVIIWSILFLLGVSTVSAGVLSFVTKFYQPSDGGIEAVNEAIFTGSFIFTFITTVILAPIMEELMVRGLVLNKLLSSVNKKAAICVSALIFGLIHLNLMQGINAFFLGIVLALVYIKTRSIIVCMLCHAANNLLAVVDIVLESNNVAHLATIDFVISIVCIVLGIVGAYFFFKSDDAKLKALEDSK